VITPRDLSPLSERPSEILQWIQEHDRVCDEHSSEWRVSSFVAIDDHPLVKKAFGSFLRGHFVQTDPGICLTTELADAAVALLMQDDPEAVVEGGCCDEFCLVCHPPPPAVEAAELGSEVVSRIRRGDGGLMEEIHGGKWGHSPVLKELFESLREDKKVKRVRLHGNLGTEGVRALIDAIEGNDTITALTICDPDANEEALGLLLGMSRQRLEHKRGLAEMRINGVVWGGQGYPVPKRWMHWEALTEHNSRLLDLGLEEEDTALCCSDPHPHKTNTEREIQLMEPACTLPGHTVASAVREDDNEEDDGACDVEGVNFDDY